MEDMEAITPRLLIRKTGWGQYPPPVLTAPAEVQGNGRRSLMVAHRRSPTGCGGGEREGAQKLGAFKLTVEGR